MFIIYKFKLKFNMKNNNNKSNLILIVTVFFAFLSYSCKAQTTFEQEQQQAQVDSYSVGIVGTWVSNDDPLWKTIYTSNGEKKDYYEDVLISKETYVITTTCNGQTLTTTYTLFLKSIDSENNTTCDFINGIHTDSSAVITLSITTDGGKLFLFTKQ